MSATPPDDPRLTAAQGQGPRALRRLAAQVERTDPSLAQAALRGAARLEPMDPAPKLALARLHAEQGDFATARREAEGVLKDAVDHAARARAAFMLGEMARVHGDPGAARRYYDTTLKIEDALLAADQGNPTAARWFARARGRVAELDAAEGHALRARSGAEGALAMLRASAAQIGEPPMLAADIADAEMRLAALELDDDRPSSARRRLGEAIGRYEALAITETKEPHWRAVLSDAWALAAEADYARNAHADARTAIDKSLQARFKLAAEYPEEVWGLAGAYRVRAALLAALGETDAATQSLAQARNLAAQLSADGSESPSRFFVHTLLDQADHALRIGDLDLAQECANGARARAENFAHRPSAAPGWLAEVGACWDRLGEVARLARAHEQALDAFARAAEFRRMALDRSPGEARFQRGLAAALVKHGDAALEAGAPQSARRALAESTTIRLRLLEAAPENAVAAHALAAALERLGLAAAGCGDAHAARGAWEDELALADRVFADDDLEGQRFRAIVESHLVSLGGIDAEQRRASALARFDELAKAGVLTTAEAALRKKLWGA